MGPVREDSDWHGLPPDGQQRRPGREDGDDAKARCRTSEGRQNADHLVGDFNYVVDKMDRINGVPAKFTGGGDEAEAQAIGILLEQAGLQELEQSEFTYRFEDCRSRIDRMYTNMGRYEWMDRDIGCVALDWDDTTSRHRPIAGFKRSTGDKGQGERPVQNHEVGGKEWSQRVKLAYLEN